MHPPLDTLKQRLQEINDLDAAGALLMWDQWTYMPPGGAEARARQLATLARLSHQRATDTTLGELLDTLRPYEQSLPYESDDAGLLRVARRNYERAVQVPADFMSELHNHIGTTFSVWEQAREANDFALVRPHLERMVELSQQYAAFFPGHDHLADPLIDMSDSGMRAATVQQLFAELRPHLIELTQAITELPPADDSFLRQPFDEQQQLDFSLRVAKQLGYEISRGRQDLSAHPFMIAFSLGDVRITTRVNPNDISDCLFSTIHEIGHALYEQGISRALEATPLAKGASSGVHESQSRLWENIVGRSRSFWSFFFPQIQAAFPQQLGGVSLDQFHRAINKVQRSLIRTEADEVTYNLHVMMRFDFELALLEGTLAVRDLPDAWRERCRSDLGVVPSSDVEGVLQDVHWFSGVVGGAFQGYTIGNVMSAQIYDAALRARPVIAEEIGQGRFGTLRSWLADNLHSHGSKYTAAELIERVSGAPLRVEPYLHYLRSKYGELYGL